MTLVSFLLASAGLAFVLLTVRVQAPGLVDKTSRWQAVRRCGLRCSR